MCFCPATFLIYLFRPAPIGPIGPVNVFLIALVPMDIVDVHQCPVVMYINVCVCVCVLLAPHSQLYRS